MFAQFSPLTNADGASSATPTTRRSKKSTFSAVAGRVFENEMRDKLTEMIPTMCPWLVRVHGPIPLGHLNTNFRDVQVDADGVRTSRSWEVDAVAHVLEKPGVSPKLRLDPFSGSVVVLTPGFVGPPPVVAPPTPAPAGKQLSPGRVTEKETKYFVAEAYAGSREEEYKAKLVQLDQNLFTLYRRVEKRRNQQNSGISSPAELVGGGSGLVGGGTAAHMLPSSPTARDSDIDITEIVSVGALVFLADKGSPADKAGDIKAYLLKELAVIPDDHLPHVRRLSSLSRLLIIVFDKQSCPNAVHALHSGGQAVHLETIAEDVSVLKAKMDVVLERLSWCTIL